MPDQNQSTDNLKIDTQKMPDMQNMLNTFFTHLGFEPDDFQKEAMQTIAKGHSVVVCAPTGSGKTLIAEYAAFQALNDGKRLFYTTPLKALSNQKYHDFKKQYGEANVGLLTGDLSVNRDARIVVMTTEIFRNMLYGIQVDPEYLTNVGYVVLDECHYMNDAERGTVWEESIIYCPSHIQAIALSATVANAQELADWINDTHHDTRLIQSNFRPVPLRFSFYDREQLMPLFEDHGNTGSERRLNRKLKLVQKGNRFNKQQRQFRVGKLVEFLHEKNMLPAIFFSFSRKDCDTYMRETKDLRLLTPDERIRIKQSIEDFIIQNPYLKHNPHLPLIANGFASHHAGLLPGIKLLVESLFQRGLIKVVFATETLAAGINMPARTTVISKLSKRADEGHRLLHANEFLQMSGRAGRRGMDDVGYVVVISSQYEGAREAAQLAASPPDALNSQFTPTYGMVLNLLQRHSLEKAEFLIRRSFGQYTAARRLKPLEEEIAEKTSLLNQSVNFECPVDLTTQDFQQYQKSKDKLQETYHFIRILKRQLKQHGPSPEITQELAKMEGKRNSLQSTIDKTACRSCNVYKDHDKAENRIQRLQKQLKQLNRVYGEQKDSYWQNFLNIHHLLKEKGYLDAMDVPTAKGKLMAQLRAENEYYMIESIFSGELNNLSPDQLAAVICALVNDSNKINQYSNFEYSHEVYDVLNRLHRLARKVHHEQEKYRVHSMVNFNPISSGLLQAWAQGIPWDRLVAGTNIAEGDIVRIVRRTADMLRQIARIEFISSNLGQDEQRALVPERLIQNARLALAAIDKAPVKEVAPVSIDEAQSSSMQEAQAIQDVSPEKPLPDEPSPAEPSQEEVAKELSHDNVVHLHKEQL
ncbi:MAG: DEAD/DEAH box helicase [Vampirovibrionales bacterium]|nr:DEAD/DEAH box helicase [Vampirovibrionales bacterium]